MHPFERHILTRYLTALAGAGRATWARWWSTTELSQWLRCHYRQIGMACLQIGSISTEPSESHDARDAIFKHLTHLRTSAPPPPSPLERRLTWLADETGLCAHDRLIIGALARLGASVEFSSLGMALSQRFHAVSMLVHINNDFQVQVISGLLRLSPSALARRFQDGQPLIALDLAEDRGGDDFAAGNALIKIARARHTDPRKFRAVIFGKPKNTPLGWDDFSHIEKEVDAVAMIVSDGVRKAAQGINNLLHGEPGTGKTAFASALASRLGLHAMFVGECTGSNAEPDRKQRIGALALAQKLSTHAEKLLLVVDEAEDIFVGVDDRVGANRRGAKVFINNLVESGCTPTLWISNYLELLGPAVLRRMTYAVEFPELDRVAKERIIRKSAARHKIPLGDSDTQALASLHVPPALIDNGMRTARLCCAGSAFAVRATSSILKVMTGGQPPSKQQDSPFHTAFAQADVDLDPLVERIVLSGRKDISRCISGPPGTGKSAFARHLAVCMGLEVIEKRASDLLGMFVGETEQNIARSFRDAEAKRAFLIFDEADSLLRDRASAGQSYEIRQVNEMLTWMERHSFPFVCTTNFAAALDPATARRFLFKLNFLPLSTEQARALFRHSFGLEPPVHLDCLHLLTPGDFAVVARKANLMGERDPTQLVQALAAEVASKPGAERRPIGFLAGRSVPAKMADGVETSNT